MGKIKKILENELIGGTQNTDVYPVTSTKAVYNEKNETLDNIINSIQTDNSVTRVQSENLFSKVSLGKNLFDKERVTSGYWFGEVGELHESSEFCISSYIAIEPSTKYYIYANEGGAYHCFYDKNLTFISSIKGGAVISSENAAYIRLTVPNSTINEAQLELGSSHTTYEPYTSNYNIEKELVGIKSQITDKSNKFKAELSNKKVISTGKNLFNKNNITKGYYLAENGVLLESSSFCVSNFISIQPNTNYYISRMGNVGAKNIWVDKDLNVIGTAEEGMAITSPENAAYIRLSVNISALDTAQLEKGNSATMYEAFTDNYDNETLFADVNTSISNIKRVKADLTFGKNKFNIDAPSSVYVDNIVTDSKGNTMDFKVGKTLDTLPDENIKNLAYNIYLGFGENTYGFLSHKIPFEKSTYTISGMPLAPSWAGVVFDKFGNVINTFYNETNTITINKEDYNNAEYFRLSIIYEKINIGVQVEEGATATEYEKFVSYINKNNLPKDVAYTKEVSSLISKSTKDKADLVVGKNKYNYDGYQAVYADNIVTDSNGNSTPFNLGKVKDTLPDENVKNLAYNIYLGFRENTYVILSRKIKFEADSYTISGIEINDGYSIIVCNSIGDIIGTSVEKTLLKSSFEGAAYFRIPIVIDRVSNVQVEEGNTATEYEPYAKLVPKSQLPKDLLYKSDIEDEVKLILPSNIYFLKNKKYNIYYKQFLKCSSLNDKYTVSISDTSSFNCFPRQINGTPSSAKVENQTISVYDFNKNIISKSCNFNIIDIPAPKTIKILDSGDSLSDLGFYQAALKELLEADNMTVKYIGTMINRVNKGSNQYAENIWGEVLSGGTMEFLTTDCGAAKILEVSNITELPVTGYPGTSYLDANNNSWVVRGFKLTQGENGKYSGKLKLGKFKSDPNYGDGSSNDGSSTSNFPLSGIITKTASQNGQTLAGDATINYTSFDNARFNPFWNPETNELDFQYYFNYWGFEVPDVYILQWSFNDIGYGFNGNDSSVIQTAKSRAKIIIDKFHEQYPSVKFIFSVGLYGSETPSFSGKFSSQGNNNDEKKYSVLSFAEEIINLFEGQDDNGGNYSDYVIVVPAYAMADAIYGYGQITDIKVNELYPSCIVKTLVNGRDGVHPPYGYALSEAALAYEAAILKLLS